MLGDDDKKPGRFTGNNEQLEHGLKRIWNEYIYQKDKDIEDKNMKVGQNRCQNIHGKNRTDEGIWSSSEYDYN